MMMGAATKIFLRKKILLFRSESIYPFSCIFSIIEYDFYALILSAVRQYICQLHYVPEFFAISFGSWI